MLLGFKKEHARGVQLGLKQTTIRAERKNRPKLGEICHCYTGLRTKQCRLLGRWTCVGVQDIKIAGVRKLDPEFPLRIELSKRILGVHDVERLLTRDGFIPDHVYSASERAYLFWEGELPLFGYLITWAWTAEGAAPLAHNFRLDGGEGELDEFYIENAAIHVERMDHSAFCVIIDAPGLPSVHIDTGLTKKQRHWYFNVWEDAIKHAKVFPISRYIRNAAI